MKTSVRLDETRSSPPPRSSLTRGGVLQRKCACHTGDQTGEMCDECRQREIGNPHDPTAVPLEVEEVLASPGQPLAGPIRRSMEPWFGHDFSDVRVHTDHRAAVSANAVHARAYTVGRHVVFAEGEYAPDTTEGKRVLTHELTHVVHQSGSAAGGVVRMGPENDPLEREANHMANLYDAGSGPGQSPHGTRVQGAHTAMRLQRLGDNPTCTDAEASGIHQAIFDARGWLNKAIPALEASPLSRKALSSLRRNFGPTYGVAANAGLIRGRLSVARSALGRIPFSCDTAGTTAFCRANHCGWAAFGSNAATICTNPVSTLDIAWPFAARCVLHESLHAAMAFMTEDVYVGDAGYPGAGTTPLKNPASYTQLTMDLS